MTFPEKRRVTVRVDFQCITIIANILSLSADRPPTNLRIRTCSNYETYYLGNVLVEKILIREMINQENTNQEKNETGKYQSGKTNQENTKQVNYELGKLLIKKILNRKITN